MHSYKGRVGSSLDGDLHFVLSDNMSYAAVVRWDISTQSFVWFFQQIDWPLTYRKVQVSLFVILINMRKIKYGHIHHRSIIG